MFKFPYCVVLIQLKRSYGSVYKAVHVTTGMTVALKRLEILDNMEEIQNEIEFMENCQGSYVVSFYGNKLEEEVMWVNCVLFL